MKSIILSVKPQEAVNILNGEQTIIIKKTAPKETPFKVYLYCTSVKNLNLNEYATIHKQSGGLIDYWHGKVVAEFVCAMIDKSDIPNYPDEMVNDSFNMTFGELKKYAKGKRLKLLRIADLKVYDKPRELGEFMYLKKERYGSESVGYIVDKYIAQVTRPPQSWQYCEEIEA